MKYTRYGIVKVVGADEDFDMFIEYRSFCTSFEHNPESFVETGKDIITGEKIYRSKFLTSVSFEKSFGYKNREYYFKKPYEAVKEGFAKKNRLLPIILTEVSASKMKTLLSTMTKEDIEKYCLNVEKAKINYKEMIASANEESMANARTKKADRKILKQIKRSIQR